MHNNSEIRQLDDAVLRMMAARIEDVKSLELAEIIAQMLSLLADSRGVGLAAPQIGYSVCVVIVASKPTSRYPNAPLMNPVVMINPTFQPLSDEQEKDWEGCLSIPGVRALVPRYRAIEVKYTDVNNALITLQLTDFVARIFQHEYDHLQGMVYLDRVENNRDIIAESEFFKLIAA
jgi:peptide deformylase